MDEFDSCCGVPPPPLPPPSYDTTSSPIPAASAVVESQSWQWNADGYKSQSSMHPQMREAPLLLNCDGPSFHPVTITDASSAHQSSEPISSTYCADSGVQPMASWGGASHSLQVCPETFPDYSKPPPPVPSQQDIPQTANYTMQAPYPVALNYSRTFDFSVPPPDFPGASLGHSASNSECSSSAAEVALPTYSGPERGFSTSGSRASFLGHSHQREQAVITLQDSCEQSKSDAPDDGSGSSSKIGRRWWEGLPAKPDSLTGIGFPAKEARQSHTRLQDQHERIKGHGKYRQKSQSPQHRYSDRSINKEAVKKSAETASSSFKSRPRFSRNSHSPDLDSHHRRSRHSRSPKYRSRSRSPRSSKRFVSCRNSSPSRAHAGSARRKRDSKERSASSSRRTPEHEDRKKVKRSDFKADRQLQPEKKGSSRQTTDHKETSCRSSSKDSISRQSILKGNGDESKEDVFAVKSSCANTDFLTEDEKNRKLLEEEIRRYEESMESEGPVWVRSAPADLYYQRDAVRQQSMVATQKLKIICRMFEEKILKRSEKVWNEKKVQRESTSDSCISRDSAEPKKSGDSIPYESSESPKEKIRQESIVDDQQTQHGPLKHCSSLTKDKDSPHVKDNKKQIKKNKDSNKGATKIQGSSNEGSISDGSDSPSMINSDGSSGSDEDDDDDMLSVEEELQRKLSNPDRLHRELWFNESGEKNDGPICRCSEQARRSGIRHGFYVGEEKLPPCDPWMNNADRIYHYFVTVSPPVNFLIKTPTIIIHDNHEFIFEGFSLMSHYPLVELPPCTVIRFNIEYTLLYKEEKMPENFCIKELDLFYQYLFKELLELVDLDLTMKGDEGGCMRFHFMPRFVRPLPDNGKEVLSMNEVLKYSLLNSSLLIEPEELGHLLSLDQFQWQNHADKFKGMIVTCPGVRPSSIRIDQLDRDQLDSKTINYPVIVHFGVRPPQLSYAGNPVYQKKWREYVKFRHLLANMPKPSREDKRKLEEKIAVLMDMRSKSSLKRDVTVVVSSQGFYCTGIMCDIVQHAMLLPVLVGHLRFHSSLGFMEKRINYKFKKRSLLQQALTHPSYKENFGTNPDHARNSLSNCGIRQPEYGDRRIHYLHTRKKGLNNLINIMSRFGHKEETESKILHNGRLEFLGDAVVEFLTTIHLYYLFPNLEEGGLATYRAAIVQNQYLAVLGEKIDLDKYFLYAHGADLCHDSVQRHAMADCFEALLGAVFIDSGIEAADLVFSTILFNDDIRLLKIWLDYPPHPLQEQEPDGDRKWIDIFPVLKKLSEFEDSIGVQFRHIRLLARAFTDRSIGFNNLTLGCNQRLEFLGDTVLQLICTEYLYKHFPEHHEGHLSLLRSSLVNNRTQALVCDDLGMTNYAMYSSLKTELKTKDRADLLESFLAALYVDKGLKYCEVFCHVCFFPRLHLFIFTQDWNDPKSKLQQCCLTLRTMDKVEPDIPIYKVLECKGPTNARIYAVAVYFRNVRLAKGYGHSIQQAEMDAAKQALANSKELFPQLKFQRKTIENSVFSQCIEEQDGAGLQEKKKDRQKMRNRVEKESPTKSSKKCCTTERVVAKKRDHSSISDPERRKNSKINSTDIGRGNSPKPTTSSTSRCESRRRNL